MVMVVCHSRLVTSDRAPGGDASHESRVGECAQDVVDRLGGNLTQIIANRTDDRVGVGMRMRIDGVEHGNPRSCHPQGSPAKQVLRVQRRGHSVTLSHFLESVKIW